MAHVQTKKDALATLVEIERQALHESLEALRGAARTEVAQIAQRLDVKKKIVDHRYKVLAGAFAIGLAVAIRGALKRRS